MTEYQNKHIPTEISEEIKFALSFYPELKEVNIDFRFKNNIGKSFMLAQPKFSQVFGSRKKRGYNIFISREINIEGETFSVIEVPKEVLIGWIGHELGHIMDYLNRSGFEMVFFGIKYISLDNFIKRAELAADTYAINHGLAEYILATKNFILNHSALSEKYKNRIKRLYLSPEETLEIVNEIDEKDTTAEKELKKAGKEVRL